MSEEVMKTVIAGATIAIGGALPAVAVGIIGSKGLTAMEIGRAHV